MIVRDAMALADKIKKLRLERGFTQEEMGNILGVSKQYIAQIESGTKQVGLNFLKKVSAVFQIPLSYFFDEEPNRIPTFTPDEVLINKIKALPEEKRETLEKVIFEFTNIKLIELPLLGVVRAGEPFEINPVSSPLDWIEVPDIGLKGDFVVRVKGDSMIDAGIMDGDLLVLSDKYSVESGELAVVVIDDKATFKRVHFKDSKIVLEPANSKYKEKEIEVDKHDIKIYKVCHIWRDLKK